jgi:hypothetical protein
MFVNAFKAKFFQVFTKLTVVKGNALVKAFKVKAIKSRELNAFKS